MAVAILGDHGVGKTKLFEIITLKSSPQEWSHIATREDGFDDAVIRIGCARYHVYDTPTYIMQQDLLTRDVQHIFLVVDADTELDSMHLQYGIPTTIVHFEPVDPLRWEAHETIDMTSTEDTHADNLRAVIETHLPRWTRYCTQLAQYIRNVVQLQRTPLTTAFEPPTSGP